MQRFPPDRAKPDRAVAERQVPGQSRRSGLARPRPSAVPLTRAASGIQAVARHPSTPPRTPRAPAGAGRRSATAGRLPPPRGRASPAAAPAPASAATRRAPWRHHPAAVGSEHRSACRDRPSSAAFRPRSPKPARDHRPASGPGTRRVRPGRAPRPGATPHPSAAMQRGARAFRECRPWQVRQVMRYILGAGSSAAYRRSCPKWQLRNDRSRSILLP